MSHSGNFTHGGTDGNLAEVLGEIARTLQAGGDVDATLEAIVTAAVNHIDGAEHAGISLVERDGTIRTVAPTDEIVTTIDRLQYLTGEGPCVDAIAERHLYRTGDLARETRWPAFVTAAADTGVVSMLSYRLFVTDTTLGALNHYSSRPDAFSDQTELEGQVFATHAAVALIGAQHEAQLKAAIETRDVIGMAKGILMQRHGLDPAQAFAMLARSSQSTNMKLHQVAAWLVEHCREL